MEPEADGEECAFALHFPENGPQRRRSALGRTDTQHGHDIAPDEPRRHVQHAYIFTLFDGSVDHLEPEFTVRVLVLSLWCYFLYQGGTSSKWFTVVVLGVFSIANIVMSVSCLFNIGGILPELPRSALVVLGVYCAARGIAFAAIAVTLVVSPSVDDFRWHQQEEAKRKSLV